MSARDRNWSFVRKRRWLVGHVVVLLTIVVFVNMGLWQLRRLEERQQFNDILTSRTSVEPAALADVLAKYGPDQDQLELRAVTAIGVYNPDEEVILRARSFNGLSGHHVLTPLELGDGTAVLIDRGWVPIDTDQPGLEETKPPDGEVTVSGVLRKTEVRGSFGPVDPGEGVLDQIARPDVARINQQTTSDLVPVYVQITDQQPVQTAEFPVMVPLPEPSEGPHRGYAVQWFLFTAVVLIGYPILLRRTAEGTAGESEQ